MALSYVGVLMLALFVAAINAGSPSPNPPPHMIYGYVVPHSHDDVGWLLTYENYYELVVNHIYSTVVEALTANASRRFISVEMAYFWKWWNETATPTQQDQVRALVANGQLETFSAYLNAQFIIGGWTMEDEATTTYTTNIDQMTEGHQFLWETLGVRPLYGWQIDPFGSSGVVHGQFAQMGFQATLTSRIDYLLKYEWQDSLSLEFMWQPSRSQGPNLSIFTHVMDVYRYSTAVGGLDWSSNPIDPVTPLNEDKLCEAIIANIQQRSQWYRTNRVLFPWGSDFLHFIAQWDFYNMDKLMDRINSMSAQTGVVVQYATLNEFFTAVRSDTNVTFPTWTGPDFHPYADRAFSYWSGYYSSRPALKGFVRATESFQRNVEVANALAVLSGLRSSDEANKETLQIGRRANGVLTHHDAVSGTSEWYVVLNYGQTATQGMDAVAPVAEQSIASLMGQPSLALSVNESVSMATLSASHPVQITLFNSLGWSIKRYVKVSVFGSVSSVTDASGAAVPFEVVKRKSSSPLPCLYEPMCGFPDAAPADLYFLATLPAVGYSTFVVSASGTAVPAAPVTSFNVPTNQQGSFVVANSWLRLTFSNNTGLLLSVQNLQSNISSPMNVELARYVPMNLHNNITEGAYVFHPAGPSTIIQSTPERYEVVIGQYVSEVRQYFTAPCTELSGQQNETCGITQVLRLYASPTGDADFENSIELSHDLGPLRLSENVVLQVNANVESGNTFYTDNNCFEAVQRTINPQQSDPISGNFFPVTCAAFVRDNSSQLMLLPDRSHSGSSQAAGRLELMLHRRIQTTDHEGPMCLNDTDRLENVQTFLVYDTPANAIRLRHRLQYLQQFPPLALFSAVGTPSMASALVNELPANIHLLSFLMPNASSTCLLRLANIYEVGEDHTYSVPTTVSLPGIFSANFTLLDQRSLTGTWSASELAERDGRSFTAPTAAYSVTLNPTDVFTFYAELSLKMEQ